MLDATVIQQGVTLLLQGLGEDLSRPGLQQTPARVARMWADFLTPVAVSATAFEQESYDEMIVVRHIRFKSFCEHHLLPFIGTACVGYIPNGRMLGLSKLVRLLDARTKQLQVQERLTRQVAEDILQVSGAHGVGVVLEAEHLCMAVRGVQRPGAQTVTSALLGSFRDSATRAEFLALARRP